jgi:hypothetical protein
VILFKNRYFRLVCPGFEMILGPPFTTWTSKEASLAILIYYHKQDKLEEAKGRCIFGRVHVGGYNNIDLIVLVAKSVCSETEEHARWIFPWVLLFRHACKSCRCSQLSEVVNYCDSTRASIIDLCQPNNRIRSRAPWSPIFVFFLKTNILKFQKIPI